MQRCLEPGQVCCAAERWFVPQQQEAAERGLQEEGTWQHGRRVAAALTGEEVVRAAPVETPPDRLDAAIHKTRSVPSAKHNAARYHIEGATLPLDRKFVAGIRAEGSVRGDTRDVAPGKTDHDRPDLGPSQECVVGLPRALLEHLPLTSAGRSRYGLPEGRRSRAGPQSHNGGSQRREG
jgi:hypothetical protein